MKYFLPVIFLLISGFCQAQKYALIDKTMRQPVAFTNTVTLEHNYHNLFAVEKDKLPQFIAELEKIAAIISDKNTSKPEAFDFKVGKTRFVGLRVLLTAEERMDVVLTTDTEGNKINMHISDAKISNSRNVYFINTWIKYIKSGLSH